MNNSFKSPQMSIKARNKKALYNKAINDIRKLANSHEEHINKTKELTTDYSLKPKYVF